MYYIDTAMVGFDSPVCNFFKEILLFGHNGYYARIASILVFIAITVCIFLKNFTKYSLIVNFLPCVNSVSYIIYIYCLCGSKFFSCFDKPLVWMIVAAFPLYLSFVGLLLSEKKLNSVVFSILGRGLALGCASMYVASWYVVFAVEEFRGG